MPWMVALPSQDLPEKGGDGIVRVAFEAHDRPCDGWFCPAVFVDGRDKSDLLDEPKRVTERKRRFRALGRCTWGAGAG